jgi:hypothetical protein
MELPAFLTPYITYARQLYTELTKNSFAVPYKMIFGSPQFPVWFVAHSVWCCAAVHRTYLKKPRTILNSLKQLITSAAMVFVSRELSAFVLKRPSPIKENPLLLPIFLAVFILLTAMPWDLFYKIVTLFGVSNITGTLEGFNQIRYFTLLLRASAKYTYWQGVQFAVSLTLTDQMIEMGFRWFFGADESPMSGSTSMGVTMVAWGGYVLATKKVIDAPYVGTVNPHVAALAVGMLLALRNSSSMVGEEPRRRTDAEAEPEREPEEKKREKVKEE